MERPAHLTYDVSDRGLSYLPHIAGTWGGRPDGYLEVHTSSAASGTYLWITSAASDDGEESQQTRHVDVASAARFADQIVEAIATHHGGDSVTNLAATIHQAMAILIEVLDTETADE